MDTKLSTNRKFRRMFANILSIVVILALVFSVMGSAFAQETTPRVGLIANPGAIEDNGFNEMAYQGLLQAQAELGISTSLYHPGDQSEYDVVLQQCADENELCIAVGFDFRFSLAEAARANPDTKWGLVDWSYPDCWEGAVEGVDCGSFTEIPNVRGLRFNEKQVGYLAGVLAGDMTTSETIGAVGGMEIPQVVAFVEGYRNGAQCTNPDVTVLTTYTGTFSDPDLGATTAQEMIAQGADVIFGAAGATGNGAITYSAQQEQWAIGVDTDQYLTVFGGGTVVGSDKLLSSAMKRVNNAVYQTIGDYVNGMFSPGTVNYDLAMDGVGLAPFHETDDSIPQEVKDNLETVRQGIIDGTVNIDDPCEPPPPPSPWLIAFPENEAVEGWEWPEGATVTLTINSALPGFYREGTAEVTSWGDPRTYVRLEFGDQYDLKVGDEVTLTDGATTRTHIVQNLSVTAVDAEADTVAGTADVGAVVQVWPHGFDQQYFIEDTAEDGTWFANFGELGFHTIEETGGRSQIVVAGNATAVDWNVPPPPAPHIVHRYHRYILAEHFIPGALVTFTTYDSQGSSEPLFELSRYADESGGAGIQAWEYPYDLAPGNYVVVTDGAITKDLVLEPVTMDVFYPDLNLLAGTTSPSRALHVDAQNDSTYCSMDVIADEGGAWRADFGETCDITEDMWTAAAATDEDGDVSEATRPEPPTGYHDYDSGDVPSWACNAGGWAMDPDSPYDDVNVRILVDGIQVMDNIRAENYREDLEISWNEGGGGCPGGTCAFEVSLWDFVTRYVAHEITVEAQDLQTGEWYPLNATPKPLTCRTYDIYTYDAVTGETRQITNLTDTDEYNPNWSPGGKWVAHNVVRADGSHGIYVTNVQTGVSVPLSGAEDGGNDAAWSPLGVLIAFDRRGVGDNSVYVVPPIGGRARLLRSDAISPDWSPTGLRLVFHQPSDGSIRTMNLNGGGVKLIAASGEWPAWSPDGKWIAYEHDGDIWKVRVGLLGAPLGQPIQVTTVGTWDGRATWSADSQTIAFHAGISDAGRDYDIWTIPAAGGTPTWLTGAPGFGDYDPAYSNDGRYLAYASFSPAGQAARSWVAAYTYDLPAGYWSEGQHRYHFEAEWNGGGETTDEIFFNASSEAEPYEGYILLRPGAVRAGVDCHEIGAIRPDQPTRFLSGYVTDYAMTYAEALVYFDSLTARAVWDDGMSADLLHHEIIPFSEDDWFQYVCTFTE